MTGDGTTLPDQAACDSFNRFLNDYAERYVAVRGNHPVQTLSEMFDADILRDIKNNTSDPEIRKAIERMRP